MNISTGGPHILLFERDQQLATLLNSELQLAGYTCHTARTAVEVFDAIARFSIRVVLVNLAQAAAARREFWVALETQSRDRKVQVVTFLCTNLAGYGPRDLEDRPQNTMADIEIDGMSGLMSLVEAVKARVPASGLESVSTLPRMPRVASENANTPQMGRPAPQAPAPSMPQQNMDVSYHPTVTDANAFGLPGRNATSQPTAASANQANIGNISQPNGQIPISNYNNADQQTYSEKIRAVLYPNQQQQQQSQPQQPQPQPPQQNSGWNPNRGAGNPPLAEPREMPNPMNNAASLNTRPTTSGPLNPPNNGQHISPDSALHRLANGLGDSESGLAQLSRMAQGMRLPTREEISKVNAQLAAEPAAPQNWAQALQAQKQAEGQQQALREQYQNPAADNATIRNRQPYVSPFNAPTGPEALYQPQQNAPGINTPESGYRQSQSMPALNANEPSYRPIPGIPQSNVEPPYRQSPNVAAPGPNEPPYRPMPGTQSSTEPPYRQGTNEPPYRPMPGNQGNIEPSYRQSQSMPALNANEPSYRQSQNMPALNANEPSYRQSQSMPALNTNEPSYRSIPGIPQGNIEPAYRQSPNVTAPGANEPSYRSIPGIAQSNIEPPYRQSQSMPALNNNEIAYRSEPGIAPNTEPPYRQSQSMPALNANEATAYRQTQGIPTQSNPDLIYRQTQNMPAPGNTGPIGQIKGTVVTNRREARPQQTPNIPTEQPGSGTPSSPEHKQSIGPIMVPNMNAAAYLAANGEQPKAQETTYSNPDPQTEDAILTKRAEAIAQSIYAATQQQTSGTENVASPALRASPIHDVTIERTGSGPAVPDGPKRPDVLSRTNYGQQQAAQGKKNLSAVTPLASIATPMPPVQNTNKNATVAAQLSQDPPKPAGEKHETSQSSELNEIKTSQEEINSSAIKQGARNTQPPEEAAAASDNDPLAQNSVLLDIVQSLPPMPDLPPPQSMQAQVLNGRATRSLNKVLLEGHLVPQDRLEVAQNIQRMLRGVDLNYQLGDILLMFKLLTPDQLLAASLVSYGLINTTQISSLGHIRQELHSIGLEYDLENLLVLFRILTPEQLREVRSSLLS